MSTSTNEFANHNKDVNHEQYKKHRAVKIWKSLKEDQVCLESDRQLSKKYMTEQKLVFVHYA